MGDVADLAKLRDLAESLKRDAAKADGALERLEKQLREDHKCESFSDAEELLEKLQKDERRARKSYESAVRKLERHWGDRLK